jgi:5-methylcytosine-specific restriction endonuclease McrA
MTKPKYTPEERKLVMAENLKKNRERAEAKGYTQKSAAREEAIKNGEKTYIGSAACKHCGSYEKYVSNWACSPCTIKRGLEKLNNEELMKPYRTKEKKRKCVDAWRKENPEKYKKQCRRYPEKNNERAAKRRASVKNQTPDLTQDQVKKILTIYEDCSMISKETGVPHEVDHIIPICKGGLHHPDNLQILTMKENRSKGVK